MLIIFGVAQISSSFESLKVKVNSSPSSVTRLGDLELLLHGLDLGSLTDIMTVSTD